MVNADLGQHPGHGRDDAYEASAARCVQRRAFDDHANHDCLRFANDLVDERLVGELEKLVGVTKARAVNKHGLRIQGPHARHLRATVHLIADLEHVPTITF